MSETKKPHKHYVNYYTYLQIMPAVDIYAVYKGDEEGLFAKPVDALAVVEVEVKYFEDSRFIDSCQEENDIVGLHLEDGFYDVCKDSNNYEGLYTKDQLKTEFDRPVDILKG